MTGTGFAQRYFRLHRFDLDFTEVTAGPRFEGSLGGEFSSNQAKASVTTRSLAVNTNDITFGGSGLTGGVEMGAEAGNTAEANTRTLARLRE